MRDEASRTIHRIGANYVRLFTTLAFGIALVPLQFAWLGASAFGVITLVGASVGIAAMMEELTRQSLIREIAGSYHKSRQEFLRSYHSAFLISAVSAVLTAFAFGVLAVAFSAFPEQDRELIRAAQWMILFEAAFTIFRVLLSPAINLFAIFEQFILHNLIIIALRASRLVATLVLFLVVGIEDPAVGLVLFGLVGAALNILVLLTAFALLCFRDRSLFPSPHRVERRVAREQLRTFGWNVGVILAQNLHERAPQLIVAALFGLEATAAYGLAFRLASYVRMFAMGVTGGLDSVAARVSSSGDTTPLLRLIRQSTRLHAMAVVPCACGVFLLATPLMSLWVGRQVVNPNVLTTAILLTQIIMIATTSRAISDAWLRILYGAGFVRRYAPTVLVGGILNPIVAFALLAIVPDENGIAAPAIAFAATYTLFHMGLLPTIGARTVGVRIRDMYAPLLRPIGAVVLPTIALASIVALVQTWSLVTFLALGTSYAAAAGIAAFFFALKSGERRRILSIMKLARA
jgi:O-antigen/teichoic acid export membrane protein